MKNKIIGIAYVITLFLILVLFKVAPLRWSYLFLLGLLLSGIEGYFLDKTYKSLIATIATIIISGLIIIGYLIATKQVLLKQNTLLIYYVLYTVTMLTIWYVMYSEKQLRARLVELNTLVEQLRKTEGFTEVLTPSEFEERSKLVLKGSKVRGEKCFYLTLKVKHNISSYVYNAITESLSNILSHTLRSHYDLIKKVDEAEFVCLLQGTDSSGVTTVENRILTNINQILEHAERFITFEYCEVNNYG